MSTYQFLSDGDRRNPRPDGRGFCSLLWVELILCEIPMLALLGIEQPPPTGELILPIPDGADLDGVSRVHDTDIGLALLRGDDTGYRESSEHLLVVLNRHRVLAHLEIHVDGEVSVLGDLYGVALRGAPTRVDLQ